MMLKIQFCFANISAEILRSNLVNTCCTECHILAHFLPNAVAVKSFKIYLRKIWSTLTAKMLVKLTPCIFPVFVSSFYFLPFCQSFKISVRPNLNLSIFHGGQIYNTNVPSFSRSLSNKTKINDKKEKKI